jgi:DNA invertase Pin-like site-specific DNA recombinase
MPRKPAPAIARTIALCYIRKSFTRDEHDTLSPERQRANIEAVCARNGWLAEWYEDAEGHKSGRSEAGRPAWLALKRRLSDPRIVAVVANDLARLHRRAWHVGRTMEELDAHNIRLVFAAPGREFDTSTPHGRMLIQFMAMHDEAYAEDVATRQKDSIAYRKSQGKSVGMPPFGTARNAAGYLEPTPAGAWLLPGGAYRAGEAGAPPAEGAQWFGYFDALTRIYALYAENRLGINRLAYQMSAEGWRFRDRKGQPRPFTRDDLRRIVANWREYAGLPTVGKAVAKNASALDHPSAALYDTGRAVLPLELLRAVATVQEARSFTVHPLGARAAARVYPLSGMVYCAHCEAQAAHNAGPRSRLNGVSQRGYITYRHVEGHQCGAKARSVPLALIEGDVARLIGLLSLSEDSLDLLTALAQESLPDATREDDARFERERAQQLARLTRKANANRHLYSEGELTREEFERKRAEIARETAYWHNRTTDTAQMTLELRQCVAALGQVAQEYPSASPEAQQALVRSLFDHLVYDLDQRQIVDFRLKSWADRYMVLRAALYQGENQGFLRPVLHTRLDSTRRRLLDALADATRAYLDQLYAALARPVSTAQRNEAIRARAAAGEAQAALAREYGMSGQRIYQIVRRIHHR